MITTEQFRLLEEIVAKQSELIEAYKSQSETQKSIINRLERTVEAMTQRIERIDNRTAKLKRMG